MSNEMKDWYAENEQEKKLLMKKENLIKGLEVMKAEVEWNYPLDYCIIIDEVIKVLEGTAAEYIEQVTDNELVVKFNRCELYAIRDGLKSIITNQDICKRKRDEAFDAQLKILDVLTKVETKTWIEVQNSWPTSNWKKWMDENFNKGEWWTPKKGEENGKEMRDDSI